MQQIEIFKKINKKDNITYINFYLKIDDVIVQFKPCFKDDFTFLRKVCKKVD